MSRGNQSRSIAAGCELEAQSPPRCLFNWQATGPESSTIQKQKTAKTVTHVPGRKCYLCVGTYNPVEPCTTPPIIWASDRGATRVGVGAFFFRLAHPALRIGVNLSRHIFGGSCGDPFVYRSGSSKGSGTGRWRGKVYGVAGTEPRRIWTTIEPV